MPGTSGTSINGTSGISGGAFVNHPNYLVKTDSTTQVSSVNFVTADNSTGRLQIAGATRTITLRVDNAGGPPNAFQPEGPFGVESVYTNTNPNRVVGDPDIWLIINVNGGDYVFPGYGFEG